MEKAQLNRVYLSSNVLEQAQKRVSLIFDKFSRIIVSISGGKDSTALFWLAVQEASKRNRKIKVFFLDQEAEYQSSIDLIERMMQHPAVNPIWFQVPINLTNATSYSQDMFRCWGEGRTWIREKNPIAIQRIEEKYPERFYELFSWLEKRNEDTAFLVGLRAEESLNRQKAMLYSGWSNIRWSTKTQGKNTFRFYTIYDWGMGDIWKFINDFNLPYNSVYDKMYRAGKNYYKTMRVSNLIHEKSFKCLSDLQVYEPETFDKLVSLVPGIHTASIYSGEKTVFNNIVLPENFKMWKDFRDHLLNTIPLKNRDRFKDMFSQQPHDEAMYKKQVRQLQLNDYENNLDIKAKKSNKAELHEKWWDAL